MNSRLEQYVGELARSMRGVPADKREADIAEMRLHLEVAVTGFVTQGDDVAAATEKALTQFGPPKVMGRKMRLTYLRGAALGLTNATFIYLLFVAAMMSLDQIHVYWDPILRSELTFRYGPAFAVLNFLWPYLWSFGVKNVVMFLLGVVVGATLTKVSARDKFLGAGIFLLHHWAYWTMISIRYGGRFAPFAWAVFGLNVLVAVSVLLLGIWLGQRKADNLVEVTRA